MKTLNNCLRWIRAAVLYLEDIRGYYLSSRKVGLSKLDAFSGACETAKKVQAAKFKDSGAMSRPGVVFTDEQKETIKSLVEANKIAEAQGVILVELNKQLEIDENT